MKALISGATGLIGSALIRELEDEGHSITCLTRSPKGENDVRWDPDSGSIDGSLEGHDAVVHLAGESIAEGRWTPSRREGIMQSRKKGTRLLAQSVAGLASPPGVMVSASAGGYYGDRGNEVLR